MRIGLTGGIGSGKSTVADDARRARRRASIDTDAIARALTAARRRRDRRRSRAAFGADFIAADGALDRARMRELVFADAGARKRGSRRSCIR